MSEVPERPESRARAIYNVAVPIILECRIFQVLVRDSVLVTDTVQVVAVKRHVASNLKWAWEYE
jgi:hypothetical protein